MSFVFAKAVLFAAILAQLQVVSASFASWSTDYLQSEVRKVTIPLTKHYNSEDNLFSQTLRATDKHANNVISRSATGWEYADGGFWYGLFTVGQTSNLSLLVDTGSGDVAINANIYQPTGKSENLHQSGSLLYLTTQANGCGSANIS